MTGVPNVPWDVILNVSVRQSPIAFPILKDCKNVKVDHSKTKSLILKLKLTHISYVELQRAIDEA